MAKAGYCSKCGVNTWLNASGGCAAGHGPECVSGVYEAAPAPTAKQSSSLVLLIVLPLIAMVSVLVLGILVAVAIPVFSASKANAQKRACIANMRTVEGAAMAFEATHEGEELAGDWTRLMSQVCPEFISSPPACIVGGTYVWVPSPDSLAGGYAQCSIHGRVAVEE